MTTFTTNGVTAIIPVNIQYTLTINKVRPEKKSLPVADIGMSILSLGSITTKLLTRFVYTKDSDSTGTLTLSGGFYFVMGQIRSSA